MSIEYYECLGSGRQSVRRSLATKLGTYASRYCTLFVDSPPSFVGNTFYITICYLSAEATRHFRRTSPIETEKQLRLEGWGEAVVSAVKVAQRPRFGQLRVREKRRLSIKSHALHEALLKRLIDISYRRQNFQNAYLRYRSWSRSSSRALRFSFQKTPHSAMQSRSPGCFLGRSRAVIRQETNASRHLLRILWSAIYAGSEELGEIQHLKSEIPSRDWCR